ncbi:M14 family zinc carboxypeptidase [Marinobacter nauticus]|uniref:Fibronectin type-III domain-containing protein n=1 Tax=Marinobacter nauticus TaxID=2743 RepID=A0A833JU25_MARNT|nr:M14 family zinc carboxypeptidase [Marinobacter nauticus]KAE8546130.1 hypothetical protein F6453_1376 [Marinobacter nauticus]
MVAPTTAFEDSTADNPPWTGLAEEATFLQTVVNDSGRASVTQVGTSAVDNNPINMVAVGYPSAPTSSELKSKSILLFIGAQHGNEPSGREMALQKIRDLAYTTDPDTQVYLRNHPVIFIPTPNPDNLAVARNNKLGNDLNRLWLSFSDAEVQAMGSVVRDYSPHIVVDFHEKIGGATQFEFLHPTNAEVTPAIANIALDIHTEGRAALNIAGYSTGLYNGSEAPFILRNSAGLRNIITVLGESSGQGDTTYLTRKQAVDGYGIFLDRVFVYHRVNADTIRDAVASANIESRQRGEDKAVIQDPNITPPAGYTVTNAQYSTVSQALALLNLAAYELSSASGYFISMAQGAKRVLPFLVDGASPDAVVAANAVGADPSLLSTAEVYNVRWRVSGGTALYGASLGVDALSLEVGGLYPDRVYEWSVQEQEGSVSSDWSAWQTFTTLPQFNLEYRDTATQATTSVPGVSGTSFELTGLEAGESYEFRVQEDDGINTSDWSGWHQFTTTAVGTDQDVTLVMGQQVTQAVVVNVDQVAVTNAIVASQQTQSQAATVEQIATLSSVDAQQATQAVSVEISTATVMDITAVLLEQVMQAQVVTVDQVAQAAAVIAQQLTQGAPLSAEQVTDLAAVVVEQITQSQAVDVSIVQPDDLTVAVIEQLTQAQSISANQNAQVAGVSAESRTEVQAISLASDYSLVTTPVQQSTQTQIVELLDGTGLNVVTLEQATQGQAATVDLTLLVGTVTGEQAMEGQTSVVAATLLLSAVDVEQLTEAEIADILGSAMLVDPRTLRVKRTTVGYTVNRITDSFRVKFKATVH